MFPPITTKSACKERCCRQASPKMPRLSEPRLSVADARIWSEILPTVLSAQIHAEEILIQQVTEGTVTTLQDQRILLLPPKRKRATLLKKDMEAKRTRALCQALPQKVGQTAHQKGAQAADLLFQSTLPSAQQTKKQNNHINCIKVRYKIHFFKKNLIKFKKSIDNSIYILYNT